MEMTTVDMDANLIEFKDIKSPLLFDWDQGKQP